MQAAYGRRTPALYPRAGAFFDRMGDDHIQRGPQCRRRELETQRLAARRWTNRSDLGAGTATDAAAEPIEKVDQTPAGRFRSGCPHRAVKDSIRAIMMIRAYRMRGHLAANLDPLRLSDSR
jgi:2-oxoglutarate dehydrogenase E1 component